MDLDAGVGERVAYAFGDERRHEREIVEFAVARGAASPTTSLGAIRR